MRMTSQSPDSNCLGDENTFPATDDISHKRRNGAHSRANNSAPSSKATAGKFRHDTSAGQNTTQESAAPSPDELAAQLQVRIEKISTAHYVDAKEFGEDVEALSRLVRQLSRAGPQHVVDAGFESLSRTLLLLMIRAETEIGYLVTLAARSNSGGDQKFRRLHMPVEVQEMLAAIDAIGNLFLRVVESRSKYRHLQSIEDRKHDREARERTGQAKPLQRRPLEQYSKTNGRGAIRSRASRLRAAQA